MQILLKTKSIIAPALCLIMGYSWAAQDHIKYDLDDANTIAIVNGKEIPYRSAQIMRDAINRGKTQLSMPEFMQGSIENQLLTEYGTKVIGIDKIIPPNTIGFDLSVALEDQFVNVIRLTFEEPLQNYINKNFAHGNLLSAATKPFSMSRKELKPYTVMKNRQSLGFTKEQIKDAKTVELIRYKFPEQKKSSAITLWDIYRRQNVQGKDILHKADTRFVKTKIHQRLGSLVVLNWLKHHSGLSEKEIEAIKDFVYNKHFKKQYITQQGLVRVLHKDNPRQTAIAKTISQKEITAYYNEHKEDYKQIDRARGRQIRTEDNATANAAFKAIQAGMPFDEVAIKYSTLKDDKGNVKIKTGWIDRTDDSDQWLRTLLYLQAVDTPTRPYRSPQTDPKNPVYWLSVITDEKVESYQKPDSPGVRYQVSRIVAEKKMIKAFAKLRKELLQQATIRINPKLMKTQAKSKK